MDNTTLDGTQYQMIFGGQRLPVPPAAWCIYYLWKDGGGYGSGANYSGSDNYDIYESDVKFEGNTVKSITLTKVGRAIIGRDGYSSSSCIYMDGKERVDMDTDLSKHFIRIEKKTPKPVQKRFMYFENCEGGMNTVEIDSETTIALSFLHGWMSDSCEEQDRKLIDWMDTCEIGEVHDHRLGCCVRLKDAK